VCGMMSTSQVSHRQTGMRLRQAFAKRYDQLHTVRVRRLLIYMIIGLAAVFALALHPVSDILGGLFIVFVGWAIPSVLNILASVLILAYLPRALGKYPIATLATAVAASLLIAIPPEARTIVHRLVSPPVLTSSIRRVITVPRGELSLSAPPLDVVANPLAAVIRMGADEGCGCSYWEVDSGANSYVFFLTKELERRIGRGIGWTLSARQSTNVLGRTDSRDPRRVDITIQVQEAGEVTAELYERSVPRYPQTFIDANRKPLSQGPFGSIVWHLLTHGTFWSPIIGEELGYYPRRQIAKFLRDAIAVSASSDS